MGWGFDSASWDAVTGPMYMGMNSGWEYIWLIVSIGLCVAAIWVGGTHEIGAYKKLEKED
jgi:hypothetical protein